MAADRPVTLYVSHEREQLDLVAALVDLIEDAVPLAERAVVCRGLPGYEGTVEQLVRSRGIPAEAPVRPLVLAMRPSGGHSDIYADLRAASVQDLPILVLGASEAEAADMAPGADVSARPLTPAGVVELLEDVAHALRSRPRVSRRVQEGVAAVLSTGQALGLPMARPAAPDTLVEGAEAALGTDDLELVVEPGDEAPERFASAHAEENQADTEPDGYHAGASGDPMPPFDPAPPVAQEVATPLPPPAAPGSQPSPGPALSDAPVATQGAAAPVAVNPVMAVDAGIDLGECVLAGVEADGMADRLRPRFGPFLDALGGDFEQLARFASGAEEWVGAVDARLDGLDGELARLGEWHVAGYQLAVLCFLAGLPPEQAPEDLGEQTAGAWEAFCAACDGVGIPTAAITDFRAMLQSVTGADGDSTARDWCVDHLRGHAGQHP